jgi:ATP synthase protein I
MSKSKGTGMILIGVGSHLAAMVITGFALGYGVDAWLDTRPVFMMLLGGLGFVGGILKAHKLLSSGLD